jgi:4-diphosphocytidyl-2-C-methyl-D-erythritol kinase
MPALRPSFGVGAPAEKAPAKINLTLRVLGRRSDGYHEIESLVAFASLADVLSFAPARILQLVVRGPTAELAGPIEDNLVLKAAQALAARIPGLKLGRFVLSKRLPVAAGLGGGSSDAAAALRLLARANRIPLDDPRLLQAARMTGADIPVCLDARPRVMRGIGDILCDPLKLPRATIILANPGVMLATKAVFSALGIGSACAARVSSPPPHGAAGLNELIAIVSSFPNDLERPAIALAPAIGDVLAALRSVAGCRLARMSGSGATCFALVESARAAMAAARSLRIAHPTWWVRTTTLLD